jgi:type II secretory pathway pseudopilin PulG
MPTQYDTYFPKSSIFSGDSTCFINGTFIEDQYGSIHFIDLFIAFPFVSSFHLEGRNKHYTDDNKIPSRYFLFYSGLDYIQLNESPEINIIQTQRKYKKTEFWNSFCDNGVHVPVSRFPITIDFIRQILHGFKIENINVVSESLFNLFSKDEKSLCSGKVSLFQYTPPIQHTPWRPPYYHGRVSCRYRENIHYCFLMENLFLMFQGNVIDFEEQDQQQQQQQQDQQQQQQQQQYQQQQDQEQQQHEDKQLPSVTTRAPTTRRNWDSMEDDEDDYKDDNFSPLSVIDENDGTFYKDDGVGMFFSVDEVDTTTTTTTTTADAATTTDDISVVQTDAVIN